MVIGSGVHTSLHLNSHHQIIYTKFFDQQRYFIRHHMTERCGTSSMPTLIISKGQLIFLIGKSTLNDVDVNDQVFVYN